MISTESQLSTCRFKKSTDSEVSAGSELRTNSKVCTNSMVSIGIKRFPTFTQPKLNRYSLAWNVWRAPELNSTKHRTIMIFYRLSVYLLSLQ